MYETEVNRRRVSSDEIPQEALALFAETKQTVLSRTVLPWSEHCTECVWPTCYSTCDLYSAREDGRCRRFAEGMVRVECPDASNAYILKITFKRWGKLWTPGNLSLRPVDQALRIEHRDYRIGTLLYQLPVPGSIKGIITGKRYSLKKRLTYRAPATVVDPTSFLLECFNPGRQSVRLSLGIRSTDPKVQVPFQKLIELSPGFQCVRVPFLEISQAINLSTPFNVELIPNDDSKEITLFFGLMEFVQELVAHQEKQETKGGELPRKVKCVVWDLDNTLWDGVLVEDGPDKLNLKPSIRQVIEELDKRGILQSVASKNDHDEALDILKRVELDDFFLAPQISWMPKSEGIKAIASQLNIGLDSLLFVDDSEFERRQVSAVLPEVRTIDAERYLEIADLEECKVPVTAESRDRRKMYRVETQRQSLAKTFAEDYIAFLRHCEIQMNVRPMNESNLERVHELTQRTNQMNFSGNRYDRSVLQRILSNPDLDTYVIEVEDRFGSYGVVGFCIVDSRTPIMTDLMFSCRIQSKRIEHAFLTFLIRKYVASTGLDFQAAYRKTPRNAPSGKVFVDIGMKELENDGDVSLLCFPRDQRIPDDGLVKITIQEPSAIA